MKGTVVCFRFRLVAHDYTLYNGAYGFDSPLYLLNLRHYSATHFPCTMKYAVVQYLLSGGAYRTNR